MAWRRCLHASKRKALSVPATDDEAARRQDRRCEAARPVAAEGRDNWTQQRNVVVLTNRNDPEPYRTALAIAQQFLRK